MGNFNCPRSTPIKKWRKHGQKSEADSKFCNQARSEYAEWLERGYNLQLLVIERENLEESEQKRRKKELETLRIAVRIVMEMIFASPGVFALLKTPEGLWEKIDELLSMIAPTKDPNAEPKK